MVIKHHASPHPLGITPFSKTCLEGMTEGFLLTLTLVRRAGGLLGVGVECL